MPVYADVREFPQRKDHSTNLPAWVQNTSDAGAINEFLQSGVQLTGEDLDYLEQHMAQAAMLESKKESIRKDIEAGGAGKARSAVHKEGEKVWLDVHQNESQTTHNGCWSVAMSAMLQSRGVDMTQQEIRAYRPFSKEEAESLDPKISRQMNTDHMMSPMDMADLFLESVPNVMVREQQFEPYGLGNKNEQRPFTRAQYMNDVSEHLKAQIHDSIEVQHTPVALLSGSHFRTITGIEGDMVYYKEPDANPNDPDKEYSMTIQELLAPGLTMENAKGVSIVRLQDLSLSQDGRSLDCPPGHSFNLDENGNVTVNRTEVQNTYDLHPDVRRKRGEESVNMIGIGQNGIQMQETVYIPKQINMQAITRPVPEREPVPQRVVRQQAPQQQAYQPAASQQTARQGRPLTPEQAGMYRNYKSLKNEQERFDFFVSCWATAADGGMTPEMNKMHDYLFRDYISPKLPDGSPDVMLAQERMLRVYNARRDAHLEAEKARQQAMQETGQMQQVQPAGNYARYVEQARYAGLVDEVAVNAGMSSSRNISLGDLEQKVNGRTQNMDSPSPAGHQRQTNRRRSRQMESPTMGGMGGMGGPQ